MLFLMYVPIMFSLVINEFIESFGFDNKLLR
jgi:hypothetical protein